VLKELSHSAGLPIQIDLATGELVFGSGVVSEPPTGRTLVELSAVLASPGASGPDPAYLLYRGVQKVADGAKLTDAGLRYDLTVLRPGTIGWELTKTAGHVHRTGPGGLAYPELYEVVHGRAAILLQSMAQDATGAPSTVVGWLVLAGPGDVILIPGNLGHLTINLGTEPLVVSDLVASAATNDYEPFQRNRGAAWYVEAEPLSSSGFLPRRNPLYPKIELPRIVTAAAYSPGPRSDWPLYHRAVQNVADYRFLVAGIGAQ
jgi:glucose-6-phosphate isomerase